MCASAAGGAAGESVEGARRALRPGTVGSRKISSARANVHWPGRHPDHMYHMSCCRDLASRHRHSRFERKKGLRFASSSEGFEVRLAGLGAWWIQAVGFSMTRHGLAKLCLSLLNGDDTAKHLHPCEQLVGRNGRPRDTCRCFKHGELVLRRRTMQSRCR